MISRCGGLEMLRRPLAGVGRLPDVSTSSSTVSYLRLRARCFKMRKEASLRKLAPLAGGVCWCGATVAAQKSPAKERRLWQMGVVDKLLELFDRATPAFADGVLQVGRISVVSCSGVLSSRRTAAYSHADGIEVPSQRKSSETMLTNSTSSSKASRLHL